MPPKTSGADNFYHNVFISSIKFIWMFSQSSAADVLCVGPLSLSHKPLLQTHFENIFTKVEIAYNEQFHHLPQCFQLYSMIVLSSLEIFHIVVQMFSKSSAADMLYM